MNVFVLCHGAVGDLFGTPGAVCDSIDAAKRAAFRADRLSWWEDSYPQRPVSVWRADTDLVTYTIHEFVLNSPEAVYG